MLLLDHERGLDGAYKALMTVLRIGVGLGSGLFEVYSTSTDLLCGTYRIGSTSARTAAPKFCAVWVSGSGCRKLSLIQYLLGAYNGSEWDGIVLKAGFGYQEGLLLEISGWKDL